MKDLMLFAATKSVLQIIRMLIIIIIIRITKVEKENFTKSISNALHKNKNGFVFQHIYNFIGFISSHNDS